MAPYTHTPIAAVRPSFFLMLLIYYAAILGYSVTATAFGVLAIQQTTSNHFAFLWAVVLGIGAAAALTGVAISIRRRTPWFEVVGTILIIATMIGYAAALALYALEAPTGRARLSALWLPLLIAILPSWRLWVMSVDGSINRRLKR